MIRCRLPSAVCRTHSRPLYLSAACLKIRLALVPPMIDNRRSIKAKM
jgi:hypothetical protein